MILEGLLTTCNPDGGPHVAVMGAMVEDGNVTCPQGLLLRPFQSTATFGNLKRTGEAVFHITDDVLLLVRAALGRLETRPRADPARGVRGWVLADACRWHALRLSELDGSQDRARAWMRVVDSGRIRDFPGLCRAMLAVVEAAILATRIHLLPAAAIAADLARLWQPVRKTGGPDAIAAFVCVVEHLQEGAPEVRAQPEFGSVLQTLHEEAGA